MRIFKPLFFTILVIAGFFPQALYAQLRVIETQVSDLVHPKQFANISEIYEYDETLSWSIFVPEAYDPTNPPGVLVYISTSSKGTPPRAWYRVFEQENIIYISANGAGNSALTDRRMANTILALNYVQSHYKTDPNKTLLSGFSGGARVSSLITEFMPGIFNGVIFIGGAFKWKGTNTSMQEALTGGTYVFVTGSGDQARAEVKKTFRQYRTIDEAKVKLIDIKGLGHNLPKMSQFKKTLSFFGSESDS